MTLSLTLLASTSTTASEPTSPLFYVALAVAIGIALTVMQRISSKRNQKATQAVLAQSGAPSGTPSATGEDAPASATADSEPPITFTVAPARPLPEDVAALRALLGDSSAEVRITRYTRPVALVTNSSVSLSDPKSGAFLTIPAADVVSVTAAKEKLHPQGTLPISRSALTLTVQRNGAQQTIVLAPITGMYDGVPLPQVQQLADAVREKLGVAAAQ